MNLNNQNKTKRKNFRVENKLEKKGDILYYNGIERLDLIRVVSEGLIKYKNRLLNFQS